MKEELNEEAKKASASIQKPKPPKPVLRAIIDAKYATLGEAK